MANKAATIAQAFPPTREYARAAEGNKLNNRQALLIRAEKKQNTPLLIGSLLGLGAALAGVSPIIAGLRPWHILVVAAFLVVTSRKGFATLLQLRITAFDVMFLGFVFLSAIVEFVNAGQLNYEPELISVFTDLFYVLAYVTVRMAVSDMDSCSRLLRGIIWSAVPMAVLGVLQLLGVEFVIRISMAIAPTEAVGNRLERGDSVRAWGLTGHWTGFGGYLTCIVAALICVMLIERHTRDRVLRRDMISLGLLFSGVLATLTFSVVLASIAIVLLSWRRLRAGVNGALAIGLVAVSAVLILGPFLSGRFDQQFDAGVSAQDLPPWLPSTLAYRFVIWQRETFPAIADRPFLGWGSGAYDGDIVGRMYPIHLDWLSAESQWFSIAIGYGILVALVFFLLIFAMGAMFIRAWKAKGGMIFAPFVTLWVALLLTSFTVAIFTNRGTPSILYILLGCAVAMRKISPAVSTDVPKTLA